MGTLYLYTLNIDETAYGTVTHYLQKLKQSKNTNTLNTQNLLNRKDIVIKNLKNFPKKLNR